MIQKNISMKKNNIIITFCIGIIIALFLKTFVFDILYISGESMLPTLQPSSFIIINKLHFGIVKPFDNKLLVQWNKPQRGDIVLFPYNNRFVIKRCVAIEGDTLVFSTESGYTLTIECGDDQQGELVMELTESQYQRLKHATHVPQDMIFVLGDNRAQSVDSREYGFVSTKNILAKKQ